MYTKYKSTEDVYHANWKKEYRRRLRRAAIAYMGGQCCQCGFDNELALQIDHIEPIRNVKSRPSNDEVYHTILDGRVDNFQLLCANCHAIKTKLEGRGF